MKTVRYLKSNSGSLSIVIDGKMHTVTPNHMNYAKILTYLKNKYYNALESLIDVGQSIEKQSVGAITIKNSMISYKGNVIDNSITKRIIQLMHEQLPFQPMLKFLENLMSNPSYRAIHEFYGFMGKCDLPITDDGYFLAYKRVTNDYKDFHTRQVDNRVGAKPSMPRNMVNDDKDQTCSEGYHFCSLSYLSQFNSGNGHIMIVKINPKDVVSIPSDYNDSKGRCCDYEVIQEHVDGEKDRVVKNKFTKAVYKSDGSEMEVQEEKKDYDDCPDCGERCMDCTCDEELDEVGSMEPNYPAPKIKFHNVRDEFGRFIPKKNAPDTVSSPYHNKRDANGRFKSRK